MGGDNQSSSVFFGVDLNCPQCGKLLADAEELHFHIRMHKKKHKCINCGSRYSRHSSLLRHQRMLHSETQLLNHQQSNASVEPVVCTDCGKSFVDPRCLLNHKRIAHKTSVGFGQKGSYVRRIRVPQICNECGKSFVSAYVLNRHKRSVHSKVKKENNNLDNNGTSAENFSCPQCKKIFKNKKGLHTHLLIHDKKHDCTICGQKYARLATLQFHFNSQHGEASVEPVLCPDCGKSFINEARMKCHKANVHRDKSTYHVCIVCDSKFRYEYKLRTHMASHHVKKCFHCEVTFDDLSKLKEHSKIHDTRIRCNRCRKTFVDKVQLSAHKLSEHAGTLVRAFVCNVCGKSFTKREGFKEHMRIHTGERPYKCTMCDKAFVQSSGLMDHVLTHTGARPHICNICGKGYGRSTMLKYHQRTHTGERPHTCDVCNKSFSYPGRLYKHKKIHSEVKMYRCEQCEASFHTKESLNRHMRIHSGVKKHVCTYCGNRFNQASNLRTHLRIHTRERPYKCEICEQTFPHHGTWKKHMENCDVF